jgi:hypothetical protein
LGKYEKTRRRSGLAFSLVEYTKDIVFDLYSRAVPRNAHMDAKGATLPWVQ